MTPSENKTLLNYYDQLTAAERYIIEFVASCRQQISRAELVKSLTQLLPGMVDAQDMDRLHVESFYKKLRDDGFLLPGNTGTTVPDAIYERAVRDAILSERYNTYLLSPYVKSEQHLYHWYGYNQQRQFHLQFRRALYAGNEVEMFHSYDLFLKATDELRDTAILPLTKLISNSDTFSWMTNGPADFFMLHLPGALLQTQLHHRQTLSFVSPLASFVFGCPHPDELRDPIRQDALSELMLLTIAECWICNQMDVAEKIALRMTGYTRTAAQAVIAFSKNDSEKAVYLFEAALKDLRKAKRRKRLFFNNTVGLIFIYTCLRYNTPETLLRLKDLLLDVKSRTNRSIYQDLLCEFAKLVDARLSPRDNVDFYIHKPWGSQIDDMERVVASIAVMTLYNRDLARSRTGLDETLQQQLDALDGSPHIQMVVNIEALQTVIRTDDRDPTSRPGPSPVYDFVSGTEDWRLVLYNISRIGQQAPPLENGQKKASAKRLIYRIIWGEWHEAYRVYPLIQKEKRGGGWTKGKAFIPRHLFDTSRDTSFFTPADQRVLSLLDVEQDRVDRRYYSDCFEPNHNDALYELAGHPYLFLEAPLPVPMEIETASPQVEIVDVNGEIEIRMYPATPCNKGYCVEKRGANLLRVTRFTKEQLTLLEALGENGVRFPVNAKNEIAEAVGHIGALAEVHSHVPDVGKKSIDIIASDTLLVRLQPFLNGLSAQFLVTPLGQTGPAFVPGHGPENVFATVANEKRIATRDMSGETQRMDRLLMALGLYYTEESGDGLYQFADEALAIEFLSELENCKSQTDVPPFEVEWPKGVTLKCSRTLFPSDFSLLINKKRKWLSIDGTLKVNDVEVYQIAALAGAQEGPRPGFIRLTDGAFLRLSKSLKKFLANLNAIGETTEDGAIQAPENAAINVMKLADEAGEVSVNAAWEKTVVDLDRTLALESKVPRQVKTTLRDYQLEGYRWLHRLSTLGLGACLADDMGLGKTLQTLALMQHRATNPKLKKPSLIVAPVSVIPGWFDEARRFVPRLKLVQYAGAGRKQILDELKAKEVLVTSYGLLQRDAGKLAKIAFDMIVLDEAQFIKNRDAARAKAAFNLQGDFRMVTTGTPVENRLGEFWSIFNFINPGLLGPYKTFQQIYEKGIQLFGDTMALDSLRWKVKPFLLRRTKDETLDELPPRTEIIRYCEMSREEAAFYEMRRRQAKNMLAQSDSKQQMMELITALTALRQAACHPRLIEPDLQIDSAKLACLKDILAELKDGGHQALIFSQFVKFLTIVRQWLDEQGITYQYMDGSSTARQRTAAVSAFQAGESDLFLISMRAGGFGLNLTAADYVVHLDPWWNPAVEDQASDRVHRIGQTRPVTVYKIVTKGTVEEKVLQIHGDKRELASGLLEGSNTVAKLDMKELIELI